MKLCRNPEKAEFFFSKTLLELTQCIIVMRDNNISDYFETIISDASDMMNQIRETTP